MLECRSTIKSHFDQHAQNMCVGCVNIINGVMEHTPTMFILYFKVDKMQLFVGLRADFFFVGWRVLHANSLFAIAARQNVYIKRFMRFRLLSVCVIFSYVMHKFGVEVWCWASVIWCVGTRSFKFWMSKLCVHILNVLHYIKYILEYNEFPCYIHLYMNTWMTMYFNIT